MRGTAPLPHGTVGYLVTDLEEFLAAADQRTRALQDALAEARARLNVADDGAVMRREIASAWITAQRDAAALHAEADAAAKAILRDAERTARGMRAHALLARRATGASAPIDLPATR